MPPRRKGGTPPGQDITVFVLIAGVAGLFAAEWCGYPGIPALWLAGIIAAWMIQPPALSGKKDTWGYPSPANPAEERKQRAYQTAKGLRTSLILPLGELAPGWPVKAAWVASVWAGVLGWLIPVIGTKHLSAPAGHWLNAVALCFLVAAVTGAARRVSGDDNPGVRLNSLGSALRTNPIGCVLSGIVGGALGVGTAVGAEKLVDRYGSLVGLKSLAPTGLSHPGIVLFHPLALWITLVAGGAGLGLGAVWTHIAMAEWKELQTARAQWAQRWEALTKEPQLPVLTKHRQVGAAVIDTFTAPSHVGAVEYLKLEPKLAPMLGAGTKVAALSCPDTGPMGPIPGSWSGTQFKVVCWPTGDAGDLAAEPDCEVAQLRAEAGMAWTAHSAGVFPEPVVAAIEPVPVTAAGMDHTDAPQLDSAHRVRHEAKRALAEFWRQLKESSPTESTLAKALAEQSGDRAGAEYADEYDSGGPPDDTADYGGTPAFDLGEDHAGASSAATIWKIGWNYPPNLGARYIRESMSEQLVESMGAPAVIDHRSGEVYVGALDEIEGDLFTSSDVAEVHQPIVKAREEDFWRARWTNALKQGANIPLLQPKTAAMANLAAPGRGSSGASVYRLAFVVNEGNSPREYKGIEEQLQTALKGATFVCAAGWPDVKQGGRPGDRHPQALCLYWSHDRVPMTPRLLVPSTSPANQWVLSGIINRVFAAVKLPAPEVVSARPLTGRRAEEHIWAVNLRLYGGVTTSQVRGQGHRIGETLGVPWVRVTGDAETCWLVMGATPQGVELADPDKDLSWVVFLDWEQAFLDSGVIGSAGEVPQLIETDHLPANQSVLSLTFSLPPGLDQQKVRENVAKLRTATGNAFIEVGPSERGPTCIRVLASRTDPLASMMPFDFPLADQVVATGGGWPFATGVDGEPVSFSAKENPHLVVVGATGSGKTVSAQALLYGAAISGAEIHVVDPVKGAADYRFIEPWAISFATDITDSTAVLKAVYAEVVRRKDLNSKHGVGSYLDLPADILPRHIVVVVDEFTSLITLESPPRTPFDDPEMEAERQEQITLRNERRTIATLIGKLAREARSAGVTVILGTQKLMAASLDPIPGGSDLKTNLARILLGSTSQGERMSALRAYDQAPDLGDLIPKGRGIFESIAASGVVIQGWFAPQSDFVANLERRLPRVESKIDLSAFRTRRDQSPGVIDLDDEDAAVSETPAEIDLGELALTLDELEVPQPESQPPASDEGESGDADPDGQGDHPEDPEEDEDHTPGRIPQDQEDGPGDEEDDLWFPPVQQGLHGTTTSSPLDNATGDPLPAPDLEDWEYVPRL